MTWVKIKKKLAEGMGTENIHTPVIFPGCVIHENLTKCE